jgi:hypothetical protein
MKIREKKIILKNEKIKIYFKNIKLIIYFIFTRMLVKCAICEQFKFLHTSVDSKEVEIVIGQHFEYSKFRSTNL